MALAGVDDGHPDPADRVQDRGRRLQPGAGELEVVAHGVDVAARPAEVDLPVDAHEGGASRVEDAVVRPRVGVGVDGSERHGCSFFSH